MSVTKASLINSLEKNLDFSGTQASDVLEALLECMKTALSSGDDVLISKFGKFCVREKKGRKGRNPSTGEDLFLDARKVVTFKPSTVLKKRMNSGNNRIP